MLRSWDRRKLLNGYESSSWHSIVVASTKKRRKLGKEAYSLKSSPNISLSSTKTSSKKKKKLHGKTYIPKQITNEAFVSEPRDYIPEWRRTLSVITFNDAVKILITQKIYETFRAWTDSYGLVRMNPAGLVGPARFCRHLNSLVDTTLRRSRRKKKQTNKNFRHPNCVA
ncbi:LOW QUALITY PROTEIN: hypothetical protein V1477_010651 [Vespula maculifrons]|uniref:Uncharacterized protein n=1 Tax=Vespula maculifrons TaxID=7453 RepID=A0ABD2C2J3_VESMC